MLYVGHFSWESGEPGEYPFGWFTMLCEAEQVDDAYEKFADLIEGLKERWDTFRNVTRVWDEDVIEVGELEAERLPPEGVLGYFQEYSEPWAVLSTALPEVPPGGVRACKWYPNGVDPEDDSEEGYEPIPIVDFTEDEEEVRS